MRGTAHNYMKYCTSVETSSSTVVFQVINEKEIQAGIEPILCFMWSNTCKLLKNTT